MPPLPACRALGLTLTAVLALGCQSCGAQSQPDIEADHQMSGALTESPHMTLTPVRPGSREDSLRAAAVADTLRSAIARYADVRVAVADGFKPFAPNVKRQKVFHYTRYGWAAEAAFDFDPAKPTSLLYRREPDGTLRLIGAMYTAPERSTLEELDRRVPLSIARWHLHTNMCIPRLGQRRRWTEIKDGKPVFGPLSPIATEAACDAVRGRFLPHVFGWMVHANVFDGTDAASIWGMHDHGMMHDEMMHDHDHQES